MSVVRWRKLSAPGESPTPRLGHTLVAIPGAASTDMSSALLIGGTDGESWGSDTYLYDVTDPNQSEGEPRGGERKSWAINRLGLGGWIKIPDGVEEGPSARSGHVAALLGGYLLVFGGFDGAKGVVHHDGHLFDLSASRWISSTPPSASTSPVAEAVPSGRAGSALASVNSNTAFLFGGNHGPLNMNDLWRVKVAPGRDTAHARWERVGPPESPTHAWPVARRGHSLTTFTDGTSGERVCFLYGGADDSDTVAQDGWVYKPSTGRWKRVRPSGDSPGPRAGHSMVELGRWLILIGGGDDDEYHGSVHALDTSDWTWVTLSHESSDTGNNPPPHAGSAAVKIAQDSILLFGGATNDGSVMSATRIMDIDTLALARASNARKAAVAAAAAAKKSASSVSLKKAGKGKGSAGDDGDEEGWALGSLGTFALAAGLMFAFSKWGGGSGGRPAPGGFSFTMS